MMPRHKKSCVDVCADGLRGRMVMVVGGSRPPSAAGDRGRRSRPGHRRSRPAPEAPEAPEAIAGTGGRPSYAAAEAKLGLCPATRRDKIVYAQITIYISHSQVADAQGQDKAKGTSHG